MESNTSLLIIRGGKKDRYSGFKDSMNVSKYDAPFPGYAKEASGIRKPL